MKKILLMVMAVATLASCAQKEEKAAITVPQVSKQDVVVENILSRRSIRSYKPEQVSKAEIDTILQCAINAPSANNKQPWEIRVIQNADLLKQINELKDGVFHNSPTLIIIAKDKSNPSSDFDCGILAENVMLSAEGLDLGTCALGSLVGVLADPKAKDIVSKLELPENYEVVLGISLGYKNETPAAKPREAGKVKYID